MPYLPIELPDDLLVFVDQEVKSGRFKSASDFVVQIIERARRTATSTSTGDASSAELEAILLGCLESGPPIQVDPNYFDRLHAELLAKHGPAA